MFKRLMVLLTAIVVSSSLYAENSKSEVTKPEVTKPIVIMQTTAGTIKLELEPEKAPKTVANFLHYVKEHKYDNTIFHRVIPGFMIQGGGFNEKLQKQKTDAPIKNESSNGLTNNIGTIAMARTSNPDSATNQFFINVANNDFLDYQDKRQGYAVFGHVTEGMDVVKAISKTKTTRKSMYSDVPVEPVIIKSVTIK